MTKKHTGTNKRKRPEKKEKMAKELANISQVASNKKMIQTSTAAKNVKKPLLINNSTKKGTEHQRYKEAHSVADEDTVKAKRVYNKKASTTILERIKKTDVNK